MAYSEFLADRIQNFLVAKGIANTEKKMMGGLCYMVDDKMCMGITGDKLMARVGPEYYDEAISRDGCQEMNFTGRALKGFVYIDPEAIEDEVDLAEWLQLCIDYNPKAKSSKKRKKK